MNVERNIELLNFIKWRLVSVYGEHPNTDFVLGLDRVITETSELVQENAKIQAEYRESLSMGQLTCKLLNKTVKQRNIFKKGVAERDRQCNQLSAQIEILNHENKSLASVLIEVNEYCQLNKIGKIGDSAGSALITYCNQLATTVEALHKTLSTVIKSASADTDFESMMIEKAKSVLSATPQQHLRQIRADAIEKALDYMYSNTSSGNSAFDDFNLIRDYAERVKAGVE